MLSQNHLETTGLKPQVGEVEKAELVVNLADKEIYTKDHNGSVVVVGTSGDDKVNKTGDTMTGNLEAPSVSVGGDYLSPFSMRNKIINGGMKINQRGLSTYTQSVYTLDRWLSAANCEVRIVSSVSVLQSGNQNWMELRGNSSTPYQGIIQRIEYGYELRNKNITVSFDWEYTSGDVSEAYLAIQKESGGTITGTQSMPNPTVNGRKTMTFLLTDVPFREWISLEIRINVGTPTSAIVRLTDVQLEEGSVATPFEQRPIGTELALCQRYYQSGSLGLWYALYSDANGLARHSLPVQMRTTPYVTQVYGEPAGTQHSIGTTYIQWSHTNVGALTNISSFTADAEL